MDDKKIWRVGETVTLGDWANYTNINHFVNVPMDTDRIVELARLLVLGATPFISAWEFEPDQPGGVDGDAIHRELRQLLGISYEEWGRSPSR